MSKFEVLKEISKGIRAFQKLVELDKNEQGAKVGQKYTEVRKLVTSWLNTRQSLESPNDLVRLEKAGSPLWKIFFKTVDEFITLRLKRTTKIAEVEDLDKDCLKNLSKLIFERNQATEIGIESISPWDSARISDVLAKNLHLPLMRHLVEILESETAEKNWEPVLESLVHARDLAIVIFYSNENVAAKSVPGEEPRKQRISLEVRGQSGNFVDVLLNMVKKGLEDINLEVPVFRQKTNLPMEIVDLLAAIQERNEYEAKLSHFHRLRAELFSSLDRESFAPSSTFITSFIDFVKTLEYILERDPSQGLLMTDSVLDLASLICDKMAIAFENGDLERFFRILFVEVKRVSRELDSCWKWIELAHDKAEQDRREHPGELLFASTVLKKYAEVQKTLASEKQENIRKYSSWVTETMQELLEEHFPKGKYWKSAKPQHSEWFVEVNEQISCLVVRSCKNYSSDLQLDAMHILANGVIETLMSHIIQTDYRYSLQGAKALTDHVMGIHDAIRDREELSEETVDRLGSSLPFLRIFIVCRILSDPGIPDQAGSHAIVAPLDQELEERIRKYGLDKNQWVNLRANQKSNCLTFCR